MCNYIMGCDAAGGLWRHLGRHLGFYQKLEIIKKRQELEIFDVFQIKYDVIKHFAAFCVQFVLYSPKKDE